MFDICEPDPCIADGCCVEACQDVAVNETLHRDWQGEGSHVVWDDGVQRGFVMRLVRTVRDGLSGGDHAVAFGKRVDLLAELDRHGALDLADAFLRNADAVGQGLLDESVRLAHLRVDKRAMTLTLTLGSLDSEDVEAVTGALARAVHAATGELKRRDGPVATTMDRSLLNFGSGWC